MKKLMCVNSQDMAEVAEAEDAGGAAVLNEVNQEWLRKDN